MVVNSLNGRAGKEPHPLARRHERELVGDAGAEGIEEEAFERMIVQGAECVRDI